MAAVFDIELHDGDKVNWDESDDDVIEIGEVNSPSAREHSSFLIVIFNFTFHNDIPYYVFLFT